MHMLKLFSVEIPSQWNSFIKKREIAFINFFINSNKIVQITFFFIYLYFYLIYPPKF